MYIPRIFDRYSEIIPVQNKTSGRGTDFCFLKNIKTYARAYASSQWLDRG